MGWLDRTGWRACDQPVRTELPVITVGLGSAYVTIDRQADGTLRAIQVGTPAVAVELVFDGDVDHIARELLELSATARLAIAELTGRYPPSETHVPAGPNVVGRDRTDR